MSSRLRVIVILLSTTIAVFAQMAYGQVSPFFPRLGERSVREEIRELENPSVILVIAVAPGSEDLASIAYSRIGRGSKVAVAFVTNGEDIPSDLNGETFYRLAARRKEEAYKALSQLGVQSYFLNIPVNEFPAGEASFEAEPGEDSVLTARLDSVIDKVEPDVIVLDRDPLYGPAASPRMSYLERIILEDMMSRRSSKRWQVSRVFAEAAGKQGRVTLPVNSEDHLWSQSYLHMADVAGEHYRSLRFHIPLWNRGRLHRYALVYPQAKRPPLSLTEGLPVIRGELEALYPYVQSVFSLEKQPDLNTRLHILRNAIDRVDAFIGAHEHGPGLSETRLLSTWILDLEKLRSTVLGVDVHYSVSDTVLAQIQLFFLRFGKIQSRAGTTGLQIVFPGVVEKKWIVNEWQKEFYPLHQNDTFRVITPKLEFNSAESPEGFASLQVRTPFRFEIVHRDSNPDLDYMYRADVPLIIAPIRSIQVLTPQVAVLRDSIIVVRLKSNSRDSARGEIYINDPIVRSAPVGVDLRGKNYVQFDTLHLVWSEMSRHVSEENDLAARARRITILANNNVPVGGFYTRYIDAKTDLRGKVAIYSVIDDSPLKIALDRLGTRAVDLRMTDSWSTGLAQYSVIVVDQYSYGNFVRSSKRYDAVKRWIEKGGRLIIFPQYGTDMKGMDGGQVNFKYLPITGASAKAVFDTSNGLFESPNHVKESDLAGGVFPMAFGSVSGSSEGSRALITSAGHLPLLVEQTVGQGEIFYSALNLAPRLLSIDETAYRLLANLLGH